MNEKQQTAVQWLQNEMINKYYIASTHKCIELFEQALAMEREQMERSFAAGWEDGVTLGHHQEPKYQTGFNYFTDTYQTDL